MTAETENGQLNKGLIQLLKFTSEMANRRAVIGRWKTALRVTNVPGKSTYSPGFGASVGRAARPLLESGSFWVLHKSLIFRNLYQSFLIVKLKKNGHFVARRGAF